MPGPMVAYVLIGGPLDGAGGLIHHAFDGDYQFEAGGRRHVYVRTADRTPAKQVIYRFAYSESVEECGGR
jgi:hypothetical protein